MNNNCVFCTKDQRLNDSFIEVCKLGVSTLYISREQTYRGKCIVVFEGHKRELFELDEKELGIYASDVSGAALAIQRAFSPDKINYGIYGDLVSHIHVHIVPKYLNGPRWGEAFEATPRDKVFLSDEDYESMKKLIMESL